MQNTNLSLNTDHIEELILANRSQAVTRMIQMRSQYISISRINFEPQPDFFAITREVAFL